MAARFFYVSESEIDQCNYTKTISRLRRLIVNYFTLLLSCRTILFQKLSHSRRGWMQNLSSENESVYLENSRLYQCRGTNWKSLMHVQQFCVVNLFVFLTLPLPSSSRHSRSHQRFPREMKPEKRAQKFHAYWWRVTTQIWVVLLIGRAAWEICFNQSETLPRSG